MPGILSKLNFINNFYKLGFESLITRIQFYIFFPFQVFHTLNSSLFPSTGGIFYGLTFHSIFFCINIVFVFSLRKKVNINFFVILGIFILYLLSVILLNLIFDNLPSKIAFIYSGFVLSIFNHFWIGYFAFKDKNQFRKDINNSFMLILFFIMVWLYQGNFDLNIIFGQSNVSYLTTSELFLLIAGLFITNLTSLYSMLFFIPLVAITQFLLYSRSAIISMLALVAITVFRSKNKLVLVSIIIINIFIFLAYIEANNIVSFNRQLSIFTNILQDTSVLSRLDIFDKFFTVFMHNPIGGDLAWHLDYYGKDGYYIHSYLSYITSFGLVTLPFLSYFFIKCFFQLIKKDVYRVFPVFIAFLIMILIAKAWMYTLVWFLIGLILSKNNED